MKVPIDEVGCISLDAPVVSAQEIKHNGATRWLIWCGYCEIWHYHGAGEGHREAHCVDMSSPYWKTGYNLVKATR